MRIIYRRTSHFRQKKYIYLENFEKKVIRSPAATLLAMIHCDIWIFGHRPLAKNTFGQAGLHIFWFGHFWNTCFENLLKTLFEACIWAFFTDMSSKNYKKSIFNGLKKRQKCGQAVQILARLAEKLATTGRSAPKFCGKQDLIIIDSTYKSVSCATSGCWDILIWKGLSILSPQIWGKFGLKIEARDQHRDG